VIVTRQRKRRSHLGRFIVPVLALAAFAAALAWPPSHRAIADGPLRPVWSTASTAGGVLVRPLTFAGQQQTITDRNREIRDLNVRLDEQRQAKVDADTRVQQLRQQVSALASQAHETPAPAPRPTAAPALGTLAAAPGESAAAAPSADEKRLADTWAAMEPEKAAAVVQRLPDGAAVRVLALMDADSAGAIMNALPPGVAARLSRAVAQVPPGTGR
jgi:flagellar motility protein MotE (MotC chaperone)